MKNIHLIPTDKLTVIGRFIDTNNLFLRTDNDIPRGESVEVYITSDEEVKEGDWVMTNGGIRFVTTLNKDKEKTFTDDGILSKQPPSPYCYLEHYKKIILTTDQDLIKDGVQPIDNEFLEWFVKNPNCEKVEVVKDKKLSSKNIYDAIEGDLVYSHRGYGGIINNLSNDVRVGIDNYIETAITSETGWETLDINNYQIYDKCYKIIIPKEEPKQIKCYCGHTNYCDCSPLEEPKQETLEEAAKRYAEEYKGEDQDPWFDFMEGAKWQQERSYSEEEVLKIINLSREICSIDGNINLDDNNLQGNLEGFSMKYTIEQIFEQFKKKQVKH